MESHVLVDHRADGVLSIMLARPERRRRGDSDPGGDPSVGRPAVEQASVDAEEELLTSAQGLNLKTLKAKNPQAGVVTEPLKGKPIAAAELPGIVIDDTQARKVC